MNEIEEITRLQNTTTFTGLNSIFEEWISKGKAEQNKELFLLGYTSLMSYPAIVMTKTLAPKEVPAANKAYDLTMRYAKDSVKRMIDSDDPRTKLAGELLVIPPSKRFLAGCNAFYMLDYLIQAECMEKEKREIDGNDYAKQWNHILTNGYKGENTERAIYDDHDHQVNSMRAIQAMSLSDESRELLSEERIKEKMNNYFPKQGGSSGSGCLIIFIIMGTLGLLASCI